MPSQFSRILVTGASGFFGGRLVEAMHLTGFSEPVAGLRHWSRAARVARYPVDIRICDILDPASLCDAMKGVDAVVHCAYIDERTSIVEGTRNVLSAAQKTGVRKIVFLSTCEVYGPHARGTIDESSPPVYSGRVYPDSKIDAEQVCREFTLQGLPLTILRPSIVYGPYSGSWIITLCQRLQSSKWGLFDEDGDGIANLVYVDDLVRATFLALESDRANGHTYNVNGPDEVTWNEYFRRFNAALGLPPLRHISLRQSRIRTALFDRVGAVKQFFVDRFHDRLMSIYLRGGIASRMMKRLKSELASTPSGRELTQLYCRKAFYSDRKLRDDLGYQPFCDVDRGLQLSVKWLQQHGFAPSDWARASHDSRRPEWAMEWQERQADPSSSSGPPSHVLSLHDPERENSKPVEVQPMGTRSVSEGR